MKCAKFNHLPSSDMSDKDCVMESGGKEMTEAQLEETSVEEMETQIDGAETHMEEEEEEERHGTTDTAPDEVPFDTTDTDTACPIPEPIDIASTASEDDEGEAMNDEAGEVAEGEEDLEEGECTSDEEPPPPDEQPAPVPASAPAADKQSSKEEKKRSRREGSKKRSHRSRTRSRSRHRSKKKKKEKDKVKVVDEISAEEAKRRAVLRKLKALESDMGLEYEEEYSEEEEKLSEYSESSDSRSRSSSPSSPRRRDKKRKRERHERDRELKRRKHESKQKMQRKSHKPCHAFMAGKCPRTAEECFYTHDPDPPQVWELCKFYLFDRCAKRDKCLYLHKGFPCKWFHTGRECPDDEENCKFSHDPLNDNTRTLLLKHVEAAPKEILGDFQRMTHDEATACIFLNEAKNKGWNTDKLEAIPPTEEKPEEPKEGNDSGSLEATPSEQEDTPGVAAPTHLKLDPIQEKLLKMQGLPGAATGIGGGASMPSVPNRGAPAGVLPSEGPTGPLPSHRGPDHPPGPREPLAVQQAKAMEGRASTQQTGTQGHILGNSSAFRRTPVRRQTQGLLGPPPDQVKPPVDHGPPHQHWSSGPGQSDYPPQRGPNFLPGPDYPLGGANRGPDYPQGNNGPDYRPNHGLDYPAVASNQGPDFSHRDAGRGPGPVDLMNVPINEEEVVGFLNKKRHADDENGAWRGEQRPGSSPEVRDGTPTPGAANDFGGPEDMPRMPKAQLALFQRIQQKQKERSQSQEQEQVPLRNGNGEDWYSDEEETESTNKPQEPPLGAPFALSGLNLPPELTNVLTAISSKGTSPGSPVSSKRVDPRKAKKGGRKEVRDKEAEEREKDQRLMDLDLGSVFGDLDLPPPSPSPPRPSEQEEDITKALGLPFKPHIVHVVKETNAGMNSHLPLEWALVPIDIPTTELNEQKYNFTAVQMEADPRLRKFAKTGMAKLKELPLPSFPAPKSDPRLAKVKAAPAPALDRRRSSEDSEGGKVYNPAKELTKARKQQQVPRETEAYSPSQEQQEFYSPGQEQGRRKEGEDAYSPGYEEQRNFQERRRALIPEPNHGGPPFDYPPQGPPDGQWQQGHPDRRGGNFSRGGGQPPRGRNNDQRFPHQYDDHGPPRDYPGSGAQMDHRGPPMDQGRPPMNDRGSLLGPRVSPVDQRGSPIDQRGPPPMDRMNDRGPPVDRRGPPMDDRGPPPVDRRGLPMDQRGLPMDHRGHPMDHRGPPMDQRGPPMDHRGPPMDQRGHPIDQRGPPMDLRGPPMNQRGPPLMDQRGPPIGHRGPPMDQRGPPMDHPDFYDNPHNRQFGGQGQGNWNGRQGSPQGDFRGPPTDRGGRGGFAPARKDPRRRD